MDLSRTQSGSANLFNVAISGDVETPLASNTNREGLIIFNDSDKNLLVSFGATASETEYSFKLLPGGYFDSGLTVYTGAIHLYWIEGASGTGKAMITELEV